MRLHDDPQPFSSAAESTARWSLSVLHDVHIEAWLPDETIVTTLARVPLGERQRLEITAEDGATSACEVLIVDRQVTIVDGQLGARVRLRPIPGEADEVARVRQRSRRKGAAATLARRIPVRVLRTDGDRCEFESPTSFDDGVVGVLSVPLDGGPQGVVRCERSVRDARRTWPWRTEARFLTAAPSRRATNTVSGTSGDSPVPESADSEQNPR